MKKQGDWIRNPSALVVNVDDQSHKVLLDPNQKTMHPSQSQATVIQSQSQLLSLDEFDNVVKHTPSFIKSQNDKIVDYVQEIESHKRTIQDLMTKNSTLVTQFNQHQTTVDKKFASIEALIRVQDKKNNKELINAFNTGRSSTFKSDKNQRLAPINALRISQMRIGSGDSRDRTDK